MSSASGAIVSGASGGGPQGPVLDVVLVGAPKHVAAEEPAAETLTPLFAKLKVAPDELAVPLVETKAKGGFASLVDRLTRREPPRPSAAHPQDPGADDADRSPRVASRTPGPASGPAQTSAAKAPAGGAPSTGGLWGQLEPCWRDSGDGARVSVRLELEFDSLGRLARPPKIIRGRGDVVDELRLRAEARALAALAACLPRNDFRYAGSVQQVEFAAGA